MIEEIKSKIEKPLMQKNIKLCDIKYAKEEGINTLFIIVESDVVDLDLCVEATQIINPIIDELDIIKEEYVLDVSGKVSGNER